MSSGTILRPVFSTRTLKDDEAERQMVDLGGWAQKTEAKCGREATIKLLECQIERCKRQDGAQ